MYKLFHIMSDIYNFFFGGEHRHKHHHHHKPYHKKQLVKQVLVINFNHNKFIVMSFQLASNQKSSIQLSLVDADSLQPVTATFTGEIEASDNTAVAITDPINGLVGVSPGTGNLTSVATWTYTDKNTNELVTKDFTTITPFEVTAVIVAENVAMVVSLGTPVHQ